MDFNEKLQELRKQKKLTQEELAGDLFVSRTAISKWESGRGYPGIDSLKEISKYFSISIDELLSGEEILSVAENENRQKENHFRDLVSGLLDCSMAMFLFLPFFGQKIGGTIYEVSLLSLTEYAFYLQTIYIITVFALIICGILTLALQNCTKAIWTGSKRKISLTLSAFGTLIFMISLQPYAAMFTFFFLIIKALMLIKWD